MNDPNLTNRVLAAVNLGRADFSKILARVNAPVPGCLVAPPKATPEAVRAVLDHLWLTCTVQRCGSPYGPQWAPQVDSMQGELQQPSDPSWKAILARCPAPPARDGSKLPEFFSLPIAIKRALLTGPANTSLILRRITAAYRLSMWVVNVADVIATCSKSSTPSAPPPTTTKRGDDG